MNARTAEEALATPGDKPAAKHTFGPWKKQGFGSIGPTPCLIVADCRGWMNADECDANESLIAAAPDLLEKLKAIVAHVDDDALDFGVFEGLFAACKESIARAEGQPTREPRQEAGQ